MRKSTENCTDRKGCMAIEHLRLCPERKKTARRGGNDDAMHLREAEPGSPEWDWMHRYDSPDNRRDSMG